MCIQQKKMFMNEAGLNNLKRVGFNLETGSSLTKRTIMSNELKTLFLCLTDSNAKLDNYRVAVIDENCLGKRTIKNRGYSFSYLKRSYGLSPEYLIFRAFRYFFDRDEKSRALLCLLAVYSRDQILKASAGYITNLSNGEKISKTDFEDQMDKEFPGRFGIKMLQSLVRNLLSSWTQSGHLSSDKSRVRQTADSGSGAVSFALLLGYLTGARGERLFHTEYAKLLDCSFEKAVELAEEASRKGWIVFNRIGVVIEVGFPNLINQQELEWIREQN